MSIRIRAWKEMSAAERSALTTQQYGRDKEERVIRRRVARIIKRVQSHGDAALRYFSQKYNGYCMPPATDRDSFRKAILVSDAERTSAAKQLSSKVRAALDLAIENAKKVQSREHATTSSGVQKIKVIDGVRIGNRRQAIASVGLYVPRGRGSFPSMMIMQGVPARLAGVPRIAVATPPSSDGSVDAATLYVADTLRINEIYKVGGAHGIAAFAFGTATIPPVDKIFGPGSKFVTIARQLLVPIVNCGMPAGPSESMIIADEHADPRATALDLMIEAEHGHDSMALLLTSSDILIDTVKRIVSDQLKHIPHPRKNYISSVLNSRFGGVIKCADYQETVDVANAIAPEHLKIDTADPHKLAADIRSAGEILLGPLSAFSIANYLVGANSILPTNRGARSWSALSVADFCTQRAEIEIQRKGFALLAPHTTALANYEQFPAHAHAINARNDGQA